MRLDCIECYVVESCADAPMRPRAWFPNREDAISYGREKFGDSAHVRALSLVAIEPSTLESYNEDLERMHDLESRVRNLQYELDEALS